MKTYYESDNQIDFIYLLKQFNCLAVPFLAIFLPFHCYYIFF